MRDLAYLHPNVTFEFIQEERRLKKRRGEEIPRREGDEKEAEQGKIGRSEEGGEGEEQDEKGRTGEEEAKEKESFCERRAVFRQSGGLDAYIEHLCLELSPLFETESIIRYEAPREIHEGTRFLSTTRNKETDIFSGALFDFYRKKRRDFPLLSLSSLSLSYT